MYTKVRGKRIGHDKWIYGNLISRVDSSIIIDSNKKAYSDIDNETIGHLLNSFDGNEIYEGDIVKSKYAIHVVEFPIDSENFKDIEIIGNIWDNPELVVYPEEEPISSWESMGK